MLARFPFFDCPNDSPLQFIDSDFQQRAEGVEEKAGTRGEGCAKSEGEKGEKKNHLLVLSRVGGVQAVHFLVFFIHIGRLHVEPSSEALCVSGGCSLCPGVVRYACQ